MRSRLRGSLAVTDGQLQIRGVFGTLLAALPADEAGIHGAPPLGDAAAYVLAAGSLAIPVLAGLLLARVLRRVVRGSKLGASDRLSGWFWGIALLLLPVLSLFCPPFSLVAVGFWDVLLTGLLAGVGLFAGAHAAARNIERKNLLLLFLSLLAGFGLLEVAARTLLPPAPTFEEPWECRFVLEPWGEYAMEEEACKMLHPDEFPDRMRGRMHRAGDARRRVLHVGDSLVYMTEPGGKSFPELLSKMEPGTVHVNAGVPGMGPDYYYLLARRWLAKERFDLVVMHLFVGNDLGDMDDIRTCSDLGPLLDYEETGAGLHAVPRFDGPEWGTFGGPPFMASPPPYSLRVACGFSVAARNLQKLYYRAAESALSNQPEEQAWSHLEAVLATSSEELAAAGVPMVVVLMPHRPWLSDARFRDRDDDMRKRIERMCAEHAIPVLVPWGEFAAAVGQLGIDRWFLDGVEDNHFSTAGHEWMAGWLHGKLPDHTPVGP